MSLLKLVTAVSIFGSIATAQAVRNVSMPGAPSSASLQAAINAALDGDVLILSGGTYSGFVMDGKGVHLYVMPGQTADIHGASVISNLPSASKVVLSGLVMHGPENLTLSQAPPPALRIESAQGDVRIDGCSLLGGSGDDVTHTGASRDAGDALVVTSSPRVLIIASTLAGGDGSSEDYECCGAGGDGGTGLRATGSRIGLYDTQLVGGEGGDQGLEGGDGGDGMSTTGADVISSGCVFSGGNGGDAVDFLGFVPGAGGHGLEIVGPHLAFLLESSASGGTAGIVQTSSTAGAPGLPFQGQSPPVFLAGQARHLSVPLVRVDDPSLQLTIEGQPGDKVWVYVSRKLDFDPQGPTPRGVLGLSPRVTLPAAVVPASGVAVVPLTLPSAALMGANTTAVVQLLARGTDGSETLSPPRHLLTLPRAGIPDCNGSGVNDLVEILESSVADCSSNLVPDSCEPDCDGNGLADSCDLLAGTQQDCNLNGIPDACDVLTTGADCGGNGVPDSCQIANGSAVDANGNGVLDICESPGIYWVDPLAAAGGDGSASMPFQDLAAAVAAAASGDTILLRDGVYTGSGNRGVNFGPRELELRSVGGAAACVFDLQGLGRALEVQGGQTQATRIEGITFVNGDVGFDAGGAIYVGGASPQVLDCRFLQCVAFYGGGLAVEGGEARVVGCEFVDCTANQSLFFGGYGGGLWVSSSTGAGNEVISCRFTTCSGRSGAALTLIGGTTDLVSHCTFQGCTASELGGALFTLPLTQAAGQVVNCLVQACEAGQRGGALFVGPTTGGVPDVGLLVSSCTIDSCSAGLSGGAIGSEGSGALIVVNSILWGSTAPTGSAIWASEGGAQVTLAHVDLEGGLSSAGAPAGSLSSAAVLSVDPLFASPLGADGILSTYGDNDLRPLAGSAVHDAGLNSLIAFDQADIDGDADKSERSPLDLDGTARRKDDSQAPDSSAGVPPIVDLGCYEHD